MIKKLAFITFIILGMNACQSGKNADDVNDAGLEQEPVVEEAPVETRRRYQPRERQESRAQPLEPREQLVPEFTEGVLAQDGPGLNLMIDASGLDAFHQSMALIASETSPRQYASLESALRMLQSYDMDIMEPGVQGLLPIVNGMTGEEIIERARQLRDQ